MRYQYTALVTICFSSSGTAYLPAWPLSNAGRHFVLAYQFYVHLDTATRGATRLYRPHALASMCRPTSPGIQHPQDVDRCAEAAAQLPSRLIHTAVHCLPTPLLTWLLHVISSTELPEDVLAFVTIGPAGQPSATGNGPGQGACTGTRHSTQPAAGIPPQLDPVKAERLLRARYFGGHQTTGVGPAGALPQVSVGLASFTLVRVFFIEAAIRRYPVALGALVMAWEERAGRQQHAQAEAERLGGPAGTALDGPPLAHSERVLLAAIQWERRRMQQQRQQRGQQQREGAGRVRSTGEGQQPQGAGAGDAGRRWDPSQQEQQQQQHEGEGAGAHGSLAGSLLQLRRTGQQYPELRHLAHEVSATCQPAGLTPAVDPETAAMYMWMYKLLSDVTSQLEPLYGRGSMPRTVVERAADMLVGVAEGPHGRVLLGGSCCREYPVVDAVLAELEAAAVRVSEQLLPYTPVGVLLHGAWCASENDHVHRMGVTDRWCKEGQGQGKAAGPGRQRRRVLDLARSWEVAAAEVGAAVEVLRPGLLEDPVSGPAWKLAVALAGRVDEAEELPDVLVRLLDALKAPVRRVPAAALALCYQSTGRCMPCACGTDWGSGLGVVLDLSCAARHVPTGFHPAGSCVFSTKELPAITFSTTIPPPKSQACTPVLVHSSMFPKGPP